MRTLIIDAEARAKAKKVKEFALARRYSIQDLLKCISTNENIPGDDPNFSLNLTDGWRVVYTIEQQPSGWYHHISISVRSQEQDKLWPHPAGIEVILSLFSLGSISACANTWSEETPYGPAMNFLYPFKEPENKLVLPIIE